MGSAGVDFSVAANTAGHLAQDWGVDVFAEISFHPARRTAPGASRYCRLGRATSGTQVLMGVNKTTES